MPSSAYGTALLLSAAAVQRGADYHYRYSPSPAAARLTPSQSLDIFAGVLLLRSEILKVIRNLSFCFRLRYKSIDTF